LHCIVLYSIALYCCHAFALAAQQVLLSKPRARRLTKNVNDPVHMRKQKFNDVNGNANGNATAGGGGGGGGGGSKRHRSQSSAAAAAAAAAATEEGDDEDEDPFRPSSVDRETAEAQAKEALRDADGDLSLITETERTADILLEGLAPAQASAQVRTVQLQYLTPRHTTPAMPQRDVLARQRWRVRVRVCARVCVKLARLLT
jgi:hypothetical protein